MQISVHPSSANKAQIRTTKTINLFNLIFKYITFLGSISSLKRRRQESGVGEVEYVGTKIPILSLDQRSNARNLLEGIAEIYGNDVRESSSASSTPRLFRFDWLYINIAQHISFMHSAVCFLLRQKVLLFFWVWLFVTYLLHIKFKKEFEMTPSLRYSAISETFSSFFKNRTARALVHRIMLTISIPNINNYLDYFITVFIASIYYR